MQRNPGGQARRGEGPKKVETTASHEERERGKHREATP